MYKSFNEMFTRLEAALDKKGSTALPVDKLREIHDRLSWERSDDLVTLFVERVEQSGGLAFLCNDKNQIASSIESLIESNGISSVVVEDHDALQALGIVEIFVSATCNARNMTAIPVDSVKNQLARTDAGVTTVMAGFADCGAVISSPGPGKARMLSELTNVHIAILHESDLYLSMSEYGPILARQLATGNVSAHTVIGGPSKTADIEKTLVQGVHGPRVFAVLILGAENFPPFA